MRAIWADILIPCYKVNCFGSCQVATSHEIINDEQAKRQRAEYLRQRGARQRSSGRVNRNRMHKQADILSRKLARHVNLC